MPFRVLIIGYGSIGRRHAEVLSKLYQEISIDIISSKKLINAYRSLEDLPNIEAYDYYIISTPTACHFRDLVKLDLRVCHKIIFVEKPLFSQEINYKSQNNNQIYVGFVMRYHPLLLRAREFLKNKKPYFVNIFCESYLPNWRPNVDYRKNYSAIKSQGGGVLFDLSHEIDYAEWLFGRFQYIVGNNEKISELEIDSDDILNVIVETEQQVKINLLLNYFSRIPRRGLVAYGNDFTMSLDLHNNVMQCVNEAGKESICCEVLERNDLFANMHNDILSKELKKNAPSIFEANKTMQTIMRMKNMMISRNNICIIGCRGGSKGVKNKNIRTIGGKPLIAHTIQQALKSKLFSHIVLTTDSYEIAEVGKKWGAEVFFLRDPEMATDTAGKLEAMQDAFRRSEEYYKEKFDVIVDLDVTSPLRLVSDITNAYNQFIQNDNDNLITAAPARKNPYFNLVEIFEKDGKEVVELSKKADKQILSRQTTPKCYDMNASIYIWKRDVFLQAKTLFTPRTGLYIMPEERSIDIDTELDFMLVELLMKQNDNKNT